jgi:hypothetical protein
MNPNSSENRAGKPQNGVVNQSITSAKAKKPKGAALPYRG